MSFRFLCGCLVLALCGPALCRGQSAASQTNAAPAAHGEDRLKQLEDRLSKSLESFSPKNMFEDAAPRTPALPPPVVPLRRPRQQDKRDNWMFQQSEDGSGTPAEQWLKDTDLGGHFSDKGKKKSDLDLFYEQLGKQRSGLNGSQSDFKPGSPFTQPLVQEQKDDADDKLPGSLKGPTKRLKEMLGGDKDSPFNPVGHGGFADWFNPKDSDNSLTPDEVKAHKAYMEEYRKLLDGPAPTVTRPAQANPAAALGALGMDSFMSSARPSATAGAAGTFVNPGTLSDRNATVLNQWNPMYVPPKPEEPKPMPLFSPQVEAPRRRF